MELGFEYLAAAFEPAGSEGTLVTAPTHYFPLVGTLVWNEDRYRPDENRGTLAANYRSKIVRQAGALAGSGPADPYALPFFLSNIVRGNVTPTTPSGATSARLWEFVPNYTAADYQSFSAIFGDNNIAAWGGSFGMLTSMGISADASGTDGVTMEVAGITKYPKSLMGDQSSSITVTGISKANPAVVTAVNTFSGGERVRLVDIKGMWQLNNRYATVANPTGTTFELSGIDSSAYADFSAYSGAKAIVQGTAPTLPAQLNGPLLVPALGTVTLDTAANPIGTTELENRVISVSYSIPQVVDPKYLFAGPDADPTFSRIGIGKRAASMTLTLEVPDEAEISHMLNDREVAIRATLPGDEIETGFRHFIQFDIVGKLANPQWGTLGQTNRSIAFTIESEFNSIANTVGYDWAIRVQNDRTAI